MRCAICKLFTPVTALLVFAGACVSTTVSMREAGRREGCEAIERKLPYFAEREVRRQRFKDDMKHRLAMLPVSFGLGAIANFLLGATIVVPGIAPDGYNLKG